MALLLLGGAAKGRNGWIARHAELWTVLRVLRAATTEATEAQRPRLAFVIVDASSAAYALNKGRVGGGSSADMQQVVTDIMDMLAAHCIVLIALWVPRGTTQLLTRFLTSLPRFLLL